MAIVSGAMAAGAASSSYRRRSTAAGAPGIMRGFAHQEKKEHAMSEATQAPPKTGTFCWNELMTRNTDACGGFYTKLFGWTTEEVPMPTGTYTIFKSGDTMAGGMMKMDGPQFEGVPSHWLSYIAVDDVDASAKKAGDLGATIACPPTDIPNIGRFAVLLDPEGNSIALFKGATV
jgi:predicted enzyme related to lactoylglutathione lyase